MMRKLHTILILLGTALLVSIIWKVGPNGLWQQLQTLGWGLLPFVICEGIGEMIHTVGWRHCLSGKIRSISWFRLFQIRMAGYAINYLTPSAALGGEVTKAALLASHEDSSQAVSAVLIGKVCFALAHLLFVTIGVPFILWKINLPRAAWLAMLSSGCLIGAGIVGFLILQQRGKLGALFRWLAARRPNNQTLRRLSDGVTEVDVALRIFYREQTRDMFMAILWHLVGFSIGIAQTWFFFRVLHENASLLVAASTWFLGMWFDMLFFAIPMNLGALEGSRILALKSGHFDAVLGLTYGIALRIAQLSWAFIGLVCYGAVSRNTEKMPANNNEHAPAGQR